MTLRDLIETGRKRLQDAGIEEYEQDVRVLIMHVLGISYTDMLMRMPEQVDCVYQQEFERCLAMRCTHMPCQYITGYQDFMGYHFKVAENVLIPRPETELLVETALKLNRNRDTVRALDVCCGSGCIGISFMLCRRAEGHEKDMVTLLDISQDAVTLADTNNRQLQADCRVIQSDLFSNVEGRYTIIMSNPPYIRHDDISDLMEEVRDFEPWLALDGGASGLDFYDRIIRKAGDYLYDEGELLFEIGYDQFEDIRRLLVDAGYTDIACIKDYAGLDRIVTARWMNR